MGTLLNKYENLEINPINSQGPIFDDKSALSESGVQEIITEARKNSLQLVKQFAIILDKKEDNECILFDYDLFFNGLTKESKYPDCLSKKILTQKVDVAANDRPKSFNSFGNK